MLSDRTSDYLETIYLLSLRQDTVGISQVAAARGVTIPTARAAVRRLKQDGCIRQEHYGKILLTDDGRERAAGVYRTHSALYRFLHGVLGVPAETADTDACRLEHGLSETTLDRLVEFLDSRTAPAPDDAPRRAR
jgi:DtxR family transcriptional regulator, Mn-dependent transcriptional regulator